MFQSSTTWEISNLEIKTSAVPHINIDPAKHGVGRLLSTTMWGPLDS
jgi:hypothetical protein